MISSGRWVTLHSWPNRLPYRVWERSVPRIADYYTHCAVYIYESLADAQGGEHYGGSGFLCHVSLPNNPKWAELYVVTNWHVVDRAKNPVIRLNRKDGSTECVQTNSADWFRHSDGDDVAVFPLRTQYEHLKIWSLHIRNFVTRQLIVDEDIGIGDDTVMIGRFVNHEGKQKNSPAVRFGNIAMMADETIVTEYGVAQESFLVEVRSLPGYSGSAVLICSAGSGPGSNDMSVRRKGKSRLGGEIDKINVFEQANFETLMTFMEPKGPYLLGIDFCHINRKTVVLDRDGNKTEDALYIQENTGMAGVIPAWKIADVLNGEELLAMRQKQDEELTKHIERSSASLDSADGSNALDEFTREDFESALKKASRKLSSEK